MAIGCWNGVAVGMGVSVGRGVPLGTGEGVNVWVGSVVRMTGTGVACAQALNNNSTAKASFLMTCGLNFVFIPYLPALLDNSTQAWHNPATI